MIGVFDSGVGGLTVVKQLIKILPNNDIIYFGDTARVPYGNKSSENIIKYSFENTEFLLKNGAKIIVIACHTASAIAADDLRKRYPNIPFFDVVKPGLDKSIKVTNKNKIGIIGTEATINSNAHKKYLHRINSKIKVYNKACPLFVPLVEENWINKNETKSIARYYLSHFNKKDIDTLVLACTHYPILKGVIRRILKSSINIVDPSLEVAKVVREYLINHPTLAKKHSGIHKYYASDLPNKFGLMGARLLGKDIKVIKI